MAAIGRPRPWNGALQSLQRGSLGSSLSQSRRWRNLGLFPVSSARHISSASGCVSMAILELIQWRMFVSLGHSRAWGRYDVRIGSGEARGHHREENHTFDNYFG